MKRFWDILNNVDFWAKNGSFWHPAKEAEFFRKFRLRHFWVFMTPKLHAKFQKKVMNSFWEIAVTNGRTDIWTNEQTNEQIGLKLSDPSAKAGVQKSRINVT